MNITKKLNFRLILTVFMLLAAVQACSQPEEPTPTPTAVDTATATVMPTFTPTVTLTLAPSATNTPLPTATRTRTPTQEPSPTEEGMPSIAAALANCPISEDPTYGVTMENAIKVGGGIFTGGIDREYEYLNALAGPNGETVSYTRGGSTDYGLVILDIYTITYSGGSNTLYLDLYNYETLYIPVGLSCAP